MYIEGTVCSPLSVISTITALYRNMYTIYQSFLHNTPREMFSCTECIKFRLLFVSRREENFSFVCLGFTTRVYRAFCNDLYLEM